jgi:hypothetical protein
LLAGTPTEAPVEKRVARLPRNAAVAAHFGEGAGPRVVLNVHRAFDLAAAGGDNEHDGRTKRTPYILKSATLVVFFSPLSPLSYPT